MKNFLLPILLVFGFTGLAQESSERAGKSFFFFKAPPGPVTTQIRSDSTENLAVPLNAKVVYLYEDEDRVYYSYWPWKDKSSQKHQIYYEFIDLNELLSSQLEISSPGSPQPPDVPVDKYFSMSVTEFEEITKPLYRRFKGFSAGAYTVPFRLRSSGDNFDFESALSLQANLIAGFGSQKEEYSWFDFSLGVGLTGVKLNEYNSIEQEDRTASAFTFSFGGVFKPSRFINGGLFWGWDFLGRTDRDTEWIHNRKPWLGVGVNLSFNEVTTDAVPINAPNAKQ